MDPDTASQCSDLSGSQADDQSEIILTLERKSVKPFKTQDEYLVAMKEDLSEWFNTLYDVEIESDTFFDSIENGVILCQHANEVQDFIRTQSVVSQTSSENSKNNRAATPLSFAESNVNYKRTAAAGTFYSRDNISNFLTWCKDLGIPDDLRFETEDLVSRKHERNVVLCLLEVARRGAKYGMLAPQLIQFEQEIDRELAEADDTTTTAVDRNQDGVDGDVIDSLQPISYSPPPQRQTCDLMSLDEMVSSNPPQTTLPTIPPLPSYHRTPFSFSLSA